MRPRETWHVRRSLVVDTPSGGCVQLAAFNHPPTRCLLASCPNAPPVTTCVPETMRLSLCTIPRFFVLCDALRPTVKNKWF